MSDPNNLVYRDQLDDNVIDMLSEDIGSNYSLRTENQKTITAALNEIHGKDVIANAVGDPLLSTDTYNEMGNKLQQMTSEFKTQLFNKGVTISSYDKLNSLINKINEIVGDGNSGLQYITGTYEAPGSIPSQSWTSLDIELNLDFKPIMMVLTIPYLSSIYEGNSFSSSTHDFRQTNFSINSLIVNSEENAANIRTYSEGVKLYFSYLDSDKATISVYNSQAYSRPFTGTCTWDIIGTREDDSDALTESLKQILVDNGVILTGNETLAELIVKVDELLDTKNNEMETNRQNLITALTNNGKELTGNESFEELIGMVEVTDGIILSPKDVKQITCGYFHTFILKNDGSIWGCGRNTYGQLGLVDATDRTTFTQVTTNINNDVKQVACGYDHAFILKNDGSVWACGHNINGQLGLGNTNSKNIFTQVTTNINNDVKQIVCGYSSTFILKNDGSIWSCGYNVYGQLGLGDTTSRNAFTQVTTNINNDVKQIICGYLNTFILKNDGSIWACGSNDYGQLGIGTNDTNAHSTFTQVTTNINNDVKQIAYGEYHTFILKNDGSVWSCGYNSNGQLGLGDTNNRKTFTQVTTNINNDVKQVACGTKHTVILKNDGSVWSCGYNNYGELGLGDVNDRYAFTQVTTNINNDVKQIAYGEHHTFILKNDGSVWSCGYNKYGELGLGDTTDKNTFNQSFKTISVTFD